MSKKYLSIEEAAAKIGVDTSELNRLREKGMIRAFADRGTWKFKEEDVDNLARSRQPDSDPDVTMLPNLEDSGTDLVFMDQDPLGQEPTLIRKGGNEDSGSDSDVRLIFDDTLQMPETKAGPSLEDSDSDVKLTPAPPSSKIGRSDSDVKLVSDSHLGNPGSDSDVQLVSSDSSGEVQLAGGSGAGSDVLTGSGIGSDILGSSADLTDESSSILDDDSGISLAEGSGVALASDSGISLEQPNDSGISLAGDSGALASDSGISLAEDSSIVLSGDSGISLADDSPPTRGSQKKGKRASDSDDLSGTIPLMDMTDDDSEDILDTQMEVPLMDDDSSEEFGSTGSTSVITLDDDDDDEYAVPSPKKKAAADLMSDDDAVVDLEEDDDAVDVEDEIIGEDDELSEDVFGADDDDFATDVETGESSAELPVAPRGFAAPVEQEWGAGVFSVLVVATVLMMACGTVMFDLVRNMWQTDAAKQNPVSTMLLDTLKTAN
ncbi:MAG: hypothetical protein ACKV0T_16380 [Planctomycetales bacterium]